MYKPPIRNPGPKAAAYNLDTDTPSTGPITTSMTLGGMRIPSVPPAATAPAESRESYPALIIVGAAMIPRTVTAAPTMPVAMAKIIDVRITPRDRDPRGGARG